MTQTAIVIRLVNESHAEVAVERASACGDSCATCAAGCSKKNILYITALNKIKAKPGEKVIIESASLKIISLAALVYILPLAFFLAVYFIADNMGARENICILTSSGAFLLGCLSVYLINRFIRRDRKLNYEIISAAS